MKFLRLLLVPYLILAGSFLVIASLVMMFFISVEVFNYFKGIL